MNRVSDILAPIIDIAPLQWQESWDNAGLLVGNPDMEIDKVLVTLDITEAVIDEAISKSCHLVVSHHPLIFKGLKHILYQNTVERIVIKAIKNDIAIAAMHTNLDNSYDGVSHCLADSLSLKKLKILQPISSKIFKLAVYCPVESADLVRTLMFEAGAGGVGNYDYCSFNAEGFGTFRANNEAHPFVGKIGELHHEPEVKVEVIVPEENMSHVVDAMLKAHPYEEVAYDIIALQNKYEKVGGGMVGELENPMSEYDFLSLVQEKLNQKVVRHSELLNKPIKKVAVCGGSGFFLLPDAKRCHADAYVTADVKYHDFFEADGSLLLVDAGHFETEQFTKQLIAATILKKNPTFAVLISEVKTNSIHYFV